MSSKTEPSPVRVGGTGAFDIEMGPGPLRRFARAVRRAIRRLWVWVAFVLSSPRPDDLPAVVEIFPRCAREVHWLVKARDGDEALRLVPVRPGGEHPDYRWCRCAGLTCRENGFGGGRWDVTAHFEVTARLDAEPLPAIA